MISSDPPASLTRTLPCNLVNNLTTNSAEQCKFIIDNDCLESDSSIDYVYLVYCELGYELRHVAVLLIALIVIILFLNLSCVADEFLCPSLLSVAKNLRMSDSLAGVTLLAFGNGCPDIFSSLAAASSGRPVLILGELLGAGIFCTSIVAGLIFIHSDFKIASRPLLRDSVFYLLAVYLIWFYSWEEKITFYGSLAFIILYVIYLIVALGGQAIHARLQGEYPLADAHIENITSEKSEAGENWFQWTNESIKFFREINEDKSQDTVHLNNDMKLYYDGSVGSTYLGSNSLARMRIEREIQSTGQKTFSRSKDTKCTNGTCEESRGHQNEAFQMVDENCQGEKLEIIFKDKFRQQKLTDQPAIKLESTHSNSNWLEPQKSNSLTYDEWDRFLSHISPIDIDNWQQSSVIGKLMNILKSPLLFATIMTVPIVDRDKRLGNWCRLLNSIHCLTVPMFGVTVTNFNQQWNPYGLSPRVWIFIPSFALAIIIFKITNPKREPKFHAALAYVGFAMSILWIYLLASEIISLLKTVGIIFSLSDTAIGLGILAWGNSLGDIVANTSLADAGYPRMALGASIGAPLLNLLMGFGLAFTLSLKPGESLTIEYSSTLTLLCSTLVIILVSLMISTLLPAEMSRRPFGYMLISGYGIYIVMAVLLEMRVI